MTDLRKAAQQALDALESGLAFDTHSDVLQNLRTALEQQAEPVSGCACRWDHEDNRVVTCERHQGWLDVIAEWADRAREAEAKLKAAQPEQQAEPVAWQWLDTAHFRKKIPVDAEPAHWRPLYTTPPQRQWVGLTDEDMRDPKTHILDFIYGARWAEAKLKERNNG